MTPKKAFDGTPLAERAAREIAARLRGSLVKGRPVLTLVDLPAVLPEVRSTGLTLSTRETQRGGGPVQMPFADVTFGFDDVATGQPPTTCVVHMQRRGTPEKGGSLWRIDSVTFRQKLGGQEPSMEFSFSQLFGWAFHVHPRARVLTRVEQDCEREES